MRDKFQSIFDWIAEDYDTHPTRFFIECIAWVFSIGCSITMAATVPNPPLLELYIFWVIGCALYAWAAWSRQSFGMLLNYFVLMSVDITGLIRMLINE